MNVEQNHEFIVLIVILLVVMIAKELYFLIVKIFSKFSRQLTGLLGGDPNEPATLGQLKIMLEEDLQHSNGQSGVAVKEIKDSLNSGIASLKLDIIDLKRIGGETRDAVLQLVAIMQDRKNRGDKI